MASITLLAPAAIRQAVLDAPSFAMVRATYDLDEGVERTIVGEFLGHMPSHPAGTPHVAIVDMTSVNAGLRYEIAVGSLTSFEVC